VVGLDVHKQTLVAGVLPAGVQRATDVVTIENRPATIQRLVMRLRAHGPLTFVYED